MKRITLLSILCMFWTIPIVLGQMSLSTSGQSGITVQNPTPGTASREYQNNDFFNTLLPVVITHSTSQDIGAEGVTCNTSGIPTENNFYRDFDLSTDFGITDGFTVSNVEFGVELANGPIQVTLNIYSTTSTFPTGYPGSLTLQGSANYTVDVAHGGTVVSVPLTATIPAGSIMVYEYNINPGATYTFFPGSNNLGQTGVSWIQSEPCDLTVPTSLADIQYPNMHLVMNVVGVEGVNLSEGILNGSVDWNSNCGDRDATVKLYQPGTAILVASYDVSIQADGSFSIPDLEIGTFDVIVKVSGYLAKGTQDVEIAAGENNLAVGAIVFGDFDNNNIVNIFDFSILVESFLSSVGDTEYNPLVDADCNDVINIFDFSAFVESFLIGGDSAPLTLSGDE